MLPSLHTENNPSPSVSSLQMYVFLKILSDAAKWFSKPIRVLSGWDCETKVYHFLSLIKDQVPIPSEQEKESQIIHTCLFLRTFRDGVRGCIRIIWAITFLETHACYHPTHSSAMSWSGSRLVCLAKVSQWVLTCSWWRLPFPQGAELSVKPFHL